MDYKFLRAIRFIKTYGSFFKPFLNEPLDLFSTSNAERAFLSVLRCEYDLEYQKGLEEIQKSIRKYAYNKNIEFLFLVKKLEFLRRLGRSKQAEKVYHKLRNSVSTVSPNIRSTVIDEIIGYCSMTNLSKNCLGKFHMDGSCLNDSAKAFIEINVGRNLIRNGNVDGLEHFKKALVLAKSIPHPSGMITSLNALAWYGLKYYSDEAVYYAKEALYWMGWYYEKPKLYVFDTTLEIVKRIQDISLYHVAKDFIFLYELSTDEERKKYKKRLTQAKRILSTTFYKSDGKIRRFLRKINKTRSLEEIISRREVFNLLHSKVKNIRGETIRKIISANYETIKDTDFPKLPGGFACEIVKKEEDLQDGIDSVINGQKNLDPFVQARKDLARQFLERIPKRPREMFIQRYLTLSDDEKSIIDRFARDYIRYDIRWGMRVKISDSMKKYAKAFHFKKTPAALAYYALNTQKEREKLLEVLEKFG